jgi:hypothetical protein
MSLSERIEISTALLSKTLGLARALGLLIQVRETFLQIQSGRHALPT